MADVCCVLCVDKEEARSERWWAAVGVVAAAPSGSYWMLCACTDYIFFRLNNHYVRASIIYIFRPDYVASSICYCLLLLP